MTKHEPIRDEELTKVSGAGDVVDIEEDRGTTGGGLHNDPGGTKSGGSGPSGLPDAEAPGGDIVDLARD